MWLSIQVPLGVLLKNENKVDEMVDVITHLHDYVPTVTKTGNVMVPGCEQPKSVLLQNFHHILLGGDQVTVVRALSSQSVRRNSTNSSDKLEGIVPVCEDWHARVVLLQVCAQCIVYNVYMHI